MKWEVIIARVLCVFMGVCHLGSLLGFLIPFLLQNSTDTISTMTLVGNIRDIVGIFTAVIIFFNSRYARIGLIILIPLNLVFSIFWMSLISISGGIILLLFGLFLYLIPLILLYQSTEKSPA